MAERPSRPAQSVLARRGRRTSWLASALALSVAGHLGALAIFGHLRPLPTLPPPEVALVELSGDLDGITPEILEPAPGDPHGTQAEMPVESAPGLVEAVPPGDEGSAPPPDALAASAAAAEAAAAAATAAELVALAALETQAVLEGQVELLAAERGELIARLAAEEGRSAGLEQRVQDLERERAAEVAAVRATYERLVEALRGEIADREVALREATDRVSVSIVDRVLFPSGQAGLTPEGQRIMDKVSEVLARTEDHRILIEGHTDNVPIGPGLRGRYPTNWELSAARASEVVKYLTARGVPGEVLTAAGRAETAPVASNETESGRRQNRRIEIVVLPPENRSPGPTTGRP